MQSCFDLLSHVLSQVPGVLLFVLQATAGQKFWCLFLFSISTVVVTNVSLTCLIFLVCYSIQAIFLDPLDFTNWILFPVSSVVLCIFARYVYQGIGLVLSFCQQAVLRLVKQVIFVSHQYMKNIGCTYPNPFLHRECCCFRVGFTQPIHRARNTQFYSRLNRLASPP